MREKFGEDVRFSRLPALDESSGRRVLLARARRRLTILALANGLSAPARRGEWWTR